MQSVLKKLIRLGVDFASFRRMKRTGTAFVSTVSLKLPITQQYPEQAWDNVELQHHLAKLRLQKVDAVS